MASAPPRAFLFRVVRFLQPLRMALRKCPEFGRDVLK
jgi:hypothetical protein